MRKIDPKRFSIAKRRTSREINRQIALTLIRTHQPVSRADLARLMGTRRGAASVLVSELLTEGLIFEGAMGEGGGRGRQRAGRAGLDTSQLGRRPRRLVASRVQGTDQSLGRGGMH